MEGARICQQSVCQTNPADHLYGMLEALIFAHGLKR
jgi:hypothetical protein